MKLASVVFAAAVVFLACSWPNPSEARPYPPFGFGYYGPGVGIHVSPSHPRRYYRPYRYAPPPYRYRRRHYRPHPAPGRCEYWHDQCVKNWGYRNPDYHGCMRHHGCR